jgi:hypothetical protein
MLRIFISLKSKDDGNQVAGKIFDYSPTTIDKLIQDGYNNASIQMDIQSMKDEITKLIIENGKIDEDHIKKLQKNSNRFKQVSKLKMKN